MVACALTGNISGEATTPLGNILGEAMRQGRQMAGGNTCGQSESELTIVRLVISCGYGWF